MVELCKLLISFIAHARVVQRPHSFLVLVRVFPVEAVGEGNARVLFGRCRRGLTLKMR